MKKKDNKNTSNQKPSQGDGMVKLNAAKNKSSTNNKVFNATTRQILSVVLAFGTFVIIVLGVAFIGLRYFGDEPEQIQGQVDARQYKVAAKVSARVKRHCVEEGQYVHAGDTLAILEAPEVNAQEQAAQATAAAAQAISDMTGNGERRENIRSSSALVAQAEAARDIARKTYKRMQTLYDEGVTTAQKRDEALAAMQATEAQVNAAKSQYEMAVNGARKEQRLAAAEQAKAARSGTDVVKSLLKETVQIASMDGEVDKIYIHDGEYLANGTAIMSLNILDDVWGTFNIREDKLNGLHTGSVITAYSPTYKKDYKLSVYYIQVEDECSTWKATKAKEGYDKRTFEVRARPMGTFRNPYKWEKDRQGLRPGMVLILK